mgnify:CR=1 FL=1
MKNTLLFSIKIILFGIILPFRIWQFSKDKLISKADTKSITNLLDKDYIATSWLDWVTDAIIFIIYPIGILIVIMVSIFTDISYWAFLALIPLYFISLIISFTRELGGSFMLLHLNVKKIRNILENKISLDQHELKKKELLEKTQLLLENFAQYLTDTRFQTLKKSFLNTLKSIATKKDLVSDLIIDQKNKILKFVDKNGNKLNVKDFSAGESEIVAFSLLWAVNISSNKYYPIVTDSPLNRLDSDHRLNFINNILKKSKHQFIFLSTNEEIGNIDDYGINNYVSKTYLIEYDKKSKTSSFKESYFSN